MNAGYLMQEPTAEEMAAEDPFGGRGAFLPLAAAGEEILAGLDRAFGGPVPAVAWPGRGAWVDTAAAGLSREEVLAWWSSR